MVDTKKSIPRPEIYPGPREKVPETIKEPPYRGIETKYIPRRGG